MTDQLAFPEELFLELHALTEDCVNGTATFEQAARLDRLMIEDQQARKLYVRYVHTLCGLRTWSEYPLVDSGGNPLIPEPALASEEIPNEAQTLPSVSPPTFLSTTFHNTIGYFPEGMPLAYLIATVVTGLGILIGSVIHVAGPTEVARQSASLPSPLSPLPSVVGRITGMVDCKWEKKGLGIRDWGLEKGSGFRGQGTGTENRQSSTFQSLIPNPQSLVVAGRQVCPRFRPDGNHLRHRGQGHLAGAGDV